MTAPAAAAPPGPSSSTAARTVGLAGLATLWFVLPFTTAFAPRLVPLLAIAGAALVALPILVEHVRRGAPRRAVGLEDVGVLLFFAGALIATFGPQAVVDRWTCILRLTQLFGFAAVYYGVLGHLRRDDGRFAYHAARIGAFAAVTQIGYALVEFFRGHQDRLTSPAFNPNFFASFLLAWTLLFVPEWLGRRGGFKRVAVAAIVLAPLMIATGSKAGVLFYCFLVTLLLIGETRIGFVRSTLLVLLLLAAAFLVPNPLRTRMLASDTNQVYPRRFYYAVAFENLRENPLGIGPGMNKHRFAPKAYYEPQPSFLHRRREVGLVHNVFLGSALETGVIGGAGVLLFAFAFLRRGISARARASRRAVGAFAGAALLWLHLQVDGLSQSAVMMSSLFFFVALARAEAERRASATARFQLALSRAASALLGLGLLALAWPGVIVVLEASHIVAGDKALRAGDPRYAFVEYQRALDVAPLDMYAQKKSLESLLYAFDKSLDPMLVQHMSLGAKRAMTLNPLDPEPALLIARALIAVHIKLDPGPDAQLLEKADEQFQRALQLDPLDVETRLARAHVVCFLGRDDEAIAEIERAIALERNYVQAYVFLAELKEDRGDFDGAALALTEALRAYEECVAIAFASRFGPVLFFQKQVETFDPGEAQTSIRRLKHRISK